MCHPRLLSRGRGLLGGERNRRISNKEFRTQKEDAGTSTFEIPCSTFDIRWFQSVAARVELITIAATSFRYLSNNYQAQWGNAAARSLLLLLGTLLLAVSCEIALTNQATEGMDRAS